MAAVTTTGRAKKTRPSAPPTPDGILQLGLCFWGSKTLLSAIELGLFTELAKGPLDSETLRQRLGLHPRGARDFFDALVALGMLKRRSGRYANTPETDLFLDAQNPATSAAYLRWPTLGSIRSGARSLKGFAPGYRKARQKQVATFMKFSTVTQHA
jgi:Dimerisation domain